MLTLLAKDFKLFFSGEKSLAKRILSVILTIIFVGCFVAIEVFLFVSILKKISNYNGATIAFVNLFLFIISIFIIILDIYNADKLFFNPKDIEQLSSRPIENGSIIASKLIFLFLTHYLISFVFIYPVIVSYGIIIHKPTIFYYIGLFYPVISFLFEGGVALLLAYPYNIFKKFLNRNLIVKFILIIALIIVGSIFYAKVLNIFIEIVAGNNINSLFTVDSINKLVKLRKYEFPTNLMIDVIFNNQSVKLMMILLIDCGIFLLGVNIAIFAYNYVRNLTISNRQEQKIHELKIRPVKQALIKKEIILLFKNSDYIISFIGLLIVQPLLIFLVLKALNTIFTTGIFSYYLLVFPNFIPIVDMLIILLFTVIISSGANQYLSMEKQAIKIMKTIPIDPVKQIIIKLAIPFILSSISLIISLLVLLISGIISVIMFIFILVLAFILLMTFMLTSLVEELKIKHKNKNTTYSTLVGYGMPIVLVIISLGLSFVNVHIIISLIMCLAIFSCILVIVTLYLKKNINNLFIDKEEGN